MKQYRTQSVQILLHDIKQVISTEGISGRNRIASTYEAMMNVESFFPARPITAQRQIYQVLVEKVSNSCPACYSTNEMQNFVSNAKQTLKEYQQALEKWLEEHGDSEFCNGVHDLSPTI